MSKFKPPSFCYHCGKSFPWTQTAIQTAIEMAVESGRLNEEEQKQFEQSVQDISKDSPRAQLAGTRMARLLGKMGSAASGAIRDIIVDIASESVKKVIWPDK